MLITRCLIRLFANSGACNLIFGGGGGTILPSEIEELQKYGITRIYAPDDGRAMGLQGMINDMLQKCDFATGQNLNGEVNHLKTKDTLCSGSPLICVHL